MVENRQHCFIHLILFIYSFMWTNVNHIPVCTLDVRWWWLWCLFVCTVQQHPVDFCYASEFKKKRHQTISQHVIYIQLHFTYQMKLIIALNSILWNGMEWNWNGNQSVISLKDANSENWMGGGGKPIPFYIFSYFLLVCYRNSCTLIKSPFILYFLGISIARSLSLSIGI